MDHRHIQDTKKIVTHARCPDGTMSALILHDVLPSAEILFVDYSDPAHKDLQPQEGVVFCDITPFTVREKGAITEASRACLKEWAAKGATVLDHHKGSADVVDIFGERGVFADEAAEPGVSGAALAHREVWLPLLRENPTRHRAAGHRVQVETLARLTGIRDTWQRQDPRWRASCAQAAALMFWPWKRLLAAGLYELEPLLGVGEVLLAQNEEADKKAIGEAHRFTHRGLRVACFEGGAAASRLASDVCDRLGDSADLVVVWHYRTEAGRLKLQFSCRSRGDFSVLDFARHFDPEGGGHTHAAGFRLEGTAASGNPYAVVEGLVEEYLVAGGGA